MSAVDGIFTPPRPYNEPVNPFPPGDPDRSALVAELEKQASEVIEIPCVVGGQRIYTGNVMDVTMPCDHGHVLGHAHMATPEVVQQAIDSAREAQISWAAMPWQDRASVMLRAAELLAGPWRARMNASTMLGQAKTCHQAEIDAACELIDFFRFNVTYLAEIMGDQPPVNSPGVWNRLDMRPLEGFVFAITPFNFTSIAVNLPCAPILMGNVALWKPSSTSLHSGWTGFELLEEAGLPPGVLNFLPGRGSLVGAPVLASPHLAGLHFTGGTNTFQHLWRSIGENLVNYRSYPRIVGETGGKDFIIAHPSADPQALAVAMLRGGFEYQGQKCSAASRVYMPASLWPEVRDRVVAGLAQMKMGDVRDFSNFLGAVIDKGAFESHSQYQAIARSTASVLSGGNSDGSVGWFVEPTLVEVEDPHHQLMEEEIFGPILTSFTYPDGQWAEALELVDSTSPYALTGAVFAREQSAINEACGRLRNAAGNFYINDKPTGAVVGQQPFGGGRASGTNDKAGSPLNLLRWVSPRTIKENLCPPTDWRYPFLG
jgi:1-pyrroline-5-carboxylate dehydrogenase